ncbi:MAG: dipeptide epimerase [Anaerolineae bacterium]|nr:dipeptide epimerase [Anaerolineae bacterium]
MQISRIEVAPTTLSLKTPYRSSDHAEVPLEAIGVVFIRIETRHGETAWGCAAFDHAITGETLEGVTHACRACADRAIDLNPLNTEQALAEMEPLTAGSPSAQCAFDIAFHDLLGLAAGMPLYRLLGGYRDRIQTSITVGLGSVRETVEMARDRARRGFRTIKVKGGLDAEEDVRRVHAVCDALPNIAIRLDADGGYSVEEALAVSRALKGRLEMLEQPVAPSDGIAALQHVTQRSPIPVLADQSVVGAASALEIAAQRAANGISIKLATCGGIRHAQEMNALARAAQMMTMVGCIHEPALLIAAELAVALSSPAVRYGDLDGHIDLSEDPTRPRFLLHDGFLIAGESPGLGCDVDL